MKTLFDQFLTQYPRWHTQRAYEHDLVAFFGSAAPPVEAIRAVTATRIAFHLLALTRESGYPAARRRLSALTSFYAWLVGQKKVEKNPAHDVVVISSFSVRDPRAAATLTARELLKTFPEQMQAIKAVLRDHGNEEAAS